MYSIAFHLSKDGEKTRWSKSASSAQMSKVKNCMETYTQLYNRKTSFASHINKICSILIAVCVCLHSLCHCIHILHYNNNNIKINKMPRHSWIYPGSMPKRREFNSNSVWMKWENRFEFESEWVAWVRPTENQSESERKKTIDRVRLRIKREEEKQQ